VNARPGPLKAFATILRPSPAMLSAYVAVLAWAGYLSWTAPGDMRAVYVVLLLIQSFSSASGFVLRARCGHFDPILVAPASRVRVALAHATASTGTGLVIWLVVSAIELAGTRTTLPLGLALPSISALLYMSAVAWAASVPFGRYSSGVVWLILAIGLAGAGKLLELRQAYLAALESTAGAWKASAAALLFPPLMVTEPSSPLALSTFVVLAAAIVAAGVGVLVIDAVDFPLVDAS
jgi:hypothetical protein